MMIEIKEYKYNVIVKSYDCASYKTHVHSSLHLEWVN